MKAIARPKKPDNTSDSIKKSPQAPKQSESLPRFKREILDIATNQVGEIFKVGEHILVEDLKGDQVKAYIKHFYQESRGIYVAYSPSLMPEKGWQWEQGCCPIDDLVRA